MQGRASLPAWGLRPHAGPQPRRHRAALRAELTLPSEATGISMWPWPGALPGDSPLPTLTSDSLPVSF